MVENLKLRFHNYPEWVISVFVFFVYWLVNKSYTGPAIMMDEIGYLTNAALISGHIIDGANSYHAGFSFFLAPLFVIFTEPAQIWQVAMILNAFLWSVSFLLLAHILRNLLPELSKKQLLVALLISTVYPSWITISGYVFTTTFFVFIYLLAISTLLFWNPDKGWTIIPHALLVGYLYWIHPLGLAVCIASFIVVGLISIRHKKYSSVLMSILLIAAFIITYNEIVDKWMLILATPEGYNPLSQHYPDSERMASKLFVYDFWVHLVAKTAGHISYLVVSSFGLILLGFVGSISRSWCLFKISNNHNCKSRNLVSQSVFLFLILSFLGVLAMGVIFFSGSASRIDHWIYGRYTEMVVLPLLALGYLSSWKKSWLYLAALFVLLTGTVLNQVADMSAENHYMHTISFWPQYFILDANFFHWMIAGSLAIVVGYTLWKISKFGKMLVILFVTVCFVTSAGVSSVLHHNIIAAQGTPSTFISTIRESYPPGTCIGFNPIKTDSLYAFRRHLRYNLHLFHLYDYNYRRMLPEEWLKNCNGLYLTYNIDGLYEEYGVKLIGKEVYSKIFLLAKDDGSTIAMPDMPKTVRDIYTAAGWSINYTISCDGSQLTELSGPAGYYEDGSIYSTGTDGFLLLDPYKRLGSGKYNFVLWGEASVADGSWADIVSKGGRTEHAKFDVRDNPESNNAVIASGAFILDEPAPNLEVRVYVGSTDNIRIDGYLIEYISGVKE